MRGNCLRSGRSHALYIFIRKVTKQTVVIIEAHHFCQLRKKKKLSNNLLSRLTPYAEEIIGDHQCEFRRNMSNTNHIFCIRHILEKKWEYKETLHQLFKNFKQACDSFRRKLLYNFLIESGIPKKIVRLINMCLN